MSRHSWRNTGWYQEAKGSRDLFATIGSIGGYSSSANIAWRGLASADYSLVSSLQRGHGSIGEESLRTRELRTLEAARNWGLGFGPGGWSSDLQLLADLQHYGTRTRLIDVTSNPMTALWFACQNPQPSGDRTLSEDGVLLAINTLGWRRIGRAMPATSYSAVEKPLTWELEEALREQLPFVVESLTPNDRLRAQEGFFLAGRVPEAGQQREPFVSFLIPYEKTTPAILKERLTRRRPPERSESEHLPFVAVLIPAALKSRVLQRLENSYNRRPRVLFPDFSGFREFNIEAESRDAISQSPNIDSSGSVLGRG
jgi:hypothetical protein